MRPRKTGLALKRRRIQLILVALIVVAAFVAVLTLRSQAVGATLPPEVQQAKSTLEFDYGITVSPMSDVGAVSLTAQDAIAAARLAEGPPESSSASATLVAFTDNHYGQVDATGHVAPTFENRHAWLVLFPSTQIPLMGPIRSSDGKPNYYIATLAVFVDSQTGQVLETASV